MTTDATAKKPDTTRRTLIQGAVAAGASGMLPGLRTAVWAQGSDKPEKEEVKIGFIPLTDCASIVMASVLGFDKKYGVKIVPSKEASWAGVRDKLVNGELDMAHVLYGLIYGVQLGTAGPKKDMAVLMNINHNGQAISLSKTLADKGAVDGPSLAKQIAKEKREYTFAGTFPTGTHTMWINYWLAASGISPVKDVKVITMPPPQMVANMRVGNMDGFCVGEPWNARAIMDGVGVTAITTQDIWKDHPEKVLGTQLDFVKKYPNTCRAVMMAVLEASRWIDTGLASKMKMAETIAEKSYVNTGVDAINQRILGRYTNGMGKTWDDPNYMRFFDDGAVNFPYLSDGMWFLTQHKRWGLLKEHPDYLAVAKQVNQIDLYKQVASAMKVNVPKDVLRTSAHDRIRCAQAARTRLRAERCGAPMRHRGSRSRTGGPLVRQPARRRGARLPTLSLYCQGLNQSTSGTATNASLINLHLATAQIGRPGAGPFSLTGQPNAMGGREVGGMANLLSAHRDLGNAEHRAEVAQLWGIDEVPSPPGKTAVEMFEAAAEGEIKALWIACTNPAQSMPDQAMVRRALERCEFVVVQEAFAATATCAYADLLLPATTWGEKDGTVTNSERRISRVRPAVAAPGEAREDWAIAKQFAERLEARLRPGRATLFGYDNAEAVWNEHRETTRGRDLDIGGLDYAQLEAAPAQWPWPAGAIEGRKRLYEDGVFATNDGRAHFFDAPYDRPAEARDACFAFALNTGRLRDQWHGMSRTGSIGRLFGHVPEPAVEMNAEDMARLKLVDGDLVNVTSQGRRRQGAGPLHRRRHRTRQVVNAIVRPAGDTSSGMRSEFPQSIATRKGDYAELVFKDCEKQVTAAGKDDLDKGQQVGKDLLARRGSLTIPAQKSAQQPPAQVFIAMHWGEEFLSGRAAASGVEPGARLAGVNALTQPAYCPLSKQPELKHAAVRIVKAELPWRLLALAWLPEDCALAAREALRSHLRDFAFASCVPFGRERSGVLFRAASTQAPAASLLAGIEAMLGLDVQAGGARLHYADAQRRQRRTMRLSGSGETTRLEAFLLAGDISAEAWIKPLVQEELPADAYGRSLLAAGAKPPVPTTPRGRQVCSCFNVSENEIAACLARTSGPSEAWLRALQAELKCGTNCGSCLPEVRRLVQAAPTSAESRPIEEPA